MKRWSYLFAATLLLGGCLASSTPPTPAPGPVVAGTPAKPKDVTPGKVFTAPEDKELTALKEKPADELVKQLSDEKGRTLAARALAARGKEAVPLLMEALSSETPEVRAAAAFALGQMGTDAAEAKAALKKMAETDTNEIARDAAMFNLDALEGK